MWPGGRGVQATDIGLKFGTSRTQISLVRHDRGVRSPKIIPTRSTTYTAGSIVTFTAVINLQSLTFFRSLFFCFMTYHHHHHHRHHHLFLNRKGRWGTTDDFATSFLHFFPVLHWPLELDELQACPFPDVVFPPLPLSALSSSPFHCALQDGFGQT